MCIKSTAKLLIEAGSQTLFEKTYESLQKNVKVMFWDFEKC